MEIVKEAKKARILSASDQNGSIFLPTVANLEMTGIVMFYLLKLAQSGVIF